MRGKRGLWGRKGISKRTRASVACTQGLSDMQTGNWCASGVGVGGQRKCIGGGKFREFCSTMGCLLPLLPEGVRDQLGDNPTVLLQAILPGEQ